MPCRVEPYADSPEARDELTIFLAREFSGTADASLWGRRLAHWWDENPYAQENPLRGWVLKNDGHLVGFLGVIPTCYASLEKKIPALIATSWVVMREYRNSAIPMAMNLQRLGRTYLLLDTTPSLEVQALISRAGWVGETRALRSLVPLGPLGQLYAKVTGQPWPSLPGQRRITTDVIEVRALARPYQQATRLEKWITPDSLRWYAAAPARQHQFLGVLDADGSLSSYLWLTPHRRRGLASWTLLEAFTTEADDAELDALIGAVVRREVTLPGPSAWLLSVMTFPPDKRWARCPTLIRDEVHVCHFHLAPPALLLRPKHTVLAEGDFGL